ncbi:MAG: hypothetical protein WC383_08690 [Gammaproteobacteria bacterium]
MKSRDLIAFLTALGITALLVLGSIYFIDEIWPHLPPAASVLIFILLAVIVIGYPIYMLGQWSNRYLERVQKRSAKGPPKDDDQGSGQGR